MKLRILLVTLGVLLAPVVNAEMDGVKRTINTTEKEIIVSYIYDDHKNPFSEGIRMIFHKENLMSETLRVCKGKDGVNLQKPVVVITTSTSATSFKQIVESTIHGCWLADPYPAGILK